MLFDQAWAIAPASLQEIMARADSGAAMDPEVDSDPRAYAVVDGVAEIPVIGPMMPRGGIFAAMFGFAGYDSIHAQIDGASADADVDAIRLRIDSPGGTVAGLDRVLLAIQETDKPVEAFVDGVAASAALWMASQVDRIVVTPLAVLGSIGVVTTVEDADGRQVVSSQTPNKLLNAETAQAHVDALAARFLADVATGRSLSTADILTATGGGGLLVGQAAVDAGLADSVARRPSTGIVGLDAEAANRHNFDGTGSARAAAEDTTMDEIEKLKEELAKRDAEILRLNEELDGLREDPADEDPEAAAEDEDPEAPADDAAPEDPEDEDPEAKAARLEAELTALKASHAIERRTAAIDDLLATGRISASAEDRTNAERTWDLEQANIAGEIHADWRPFTALYSARAVGSVVPVAPKGHGGTVPKAPLTGAAYVHEFIAEHKAATGKDLQVHTATAMISAGPNAHRLNKTR